MTRKLDRVRVFFDSDRRRVNIAFVGIAVLAIGGIYLNARTNQNQLKVAKAEAIREAETRTTYQTCVASIPEFEKLSEHVQGVNEFDDATQNLAGALADLADTLSQNSTASIEARPPDDPLLPTARANLGRLIEAEARVAAARQEMTVAREKVAAVTTFPAQTVAECAARRDALEHG